MNFGCAAYNTPAELTKNFNGVDTIRNVRLGLAGVTSTRGKLVAKIAMDKIDSYNNRREEDRAVYFKAECADAILSERMTIDAIHGSLSQCGMIKNLRVTHPKERGVDTQLIVGDLVLTGAKMRTFLSLIVEGEKDQKIFFSPKLYTEESKTGTHKVVSIITFNACSRII